MKTFKSFLQLDELTGVAPKSKGEHKFVHTTYLAQIKDPGDLEKVGPEEVGPHDTKMGSGKRPADRLDNKQKFGESVELEENYRTLAQKGIGAETKGSIKVGHGVDYYHPKTGDKHMGKIHSVSDKGYVVKDDKTGEKHSFDYFRKEDVELEGVELDEAPYTGKGNHRPGWMLRADPELAKKFKEKEELAKKKQKAYGDPNAGKSVKEESELDEEVPMAARALYAQTYAKHGKTASQSSAAKQKAYDAVEKKHGAKVLAQLKAHHEKNMNEESELDEADFSKAQTKMAHTIGKYFKKKGVGDTSKGGPFAVASAMVRDKPAAAQKAYSTIKAKMKNEDHQDMLMALYDSLNEENQELFTVMLDNDPEKLLSFAESVLSKE